jgi:type I restriction enzyme, S subunit
MNTQNKLIKVKIIEIGTDFGDAPFGTSLKTKDYTTQGIPVIQGRNIKDNRFEWNSHLYVSKEKYDSLKRSHCREGDLAFPKVGTIGICAIMPRIEGHVEYLLSTNMMKISVDSKKADIKYIYYYFCQRNVQNYIRSIAGGSSQPIFNFTTLKNFEILLHPLPTQRKIAAVLSAYDDLIENNLRRIKILEEMAQNLYREWFVKFRFSGHEKVKMVDSTLGRIPEGWEVKKLGEIIELAYGKALKAEDRIKGSFPVYGSAGISGYHNKSLIKGPGIIVGRKGNVGSIWWSSTDFFPIDTVFYVNTNFNLYYLYYNLQTLNFINNDAAVPGLNRNQACLIKTLKPDNKTMTLFSEQIVPIFSFLDNLRNRNNFLRQTRDLLLPELISGELDVSELDIKVGENK